jgi:dolichol-phosphate mannosyltransferase
MQNKILIFIPTYNEFKNISALYGELKKLHQPCDYLFIDDNSPDGTGAYLETISRKDPAVKVVHRGGKEGIGSAHKAAFQYAKERKYQYILSMDADFTHSPKDIPSIIAKIENNDCVIGSRYCHAKGFKDWSLARRTLSFCSHFVTKYFLGLPYDCTGAFRMYRVDTVFEDDFYTDIKSNGYSFFIESMYQIKKRGARISEVPIVASERYLGESKISRIEIIRAGFRAFVLFCDRIRTSLVRPVRNLRNRV